MWGEWGSEDRVGVGETSVTDERGTRLQPRLGRTRLSRYVLGTEGRCRPRVTTHWVRRETGDRYDW